MCREYLVGAVIQLFAIHFSPLMMSHPPCNEYRSTEPRRPLSGSIKLLYHIMAVPFLGGMTRFARWQLTLRLNSSVVALGSSSSYIRRIKERNVETGQRLVLHQRILPFITYFVLLLHLTYSDIG